MPNGRQQCQGNNGGSTWEQQDSPDRRFVAQLRVAGPDFEWRPWLNLALVGILVLVGALEVSTFRYWNPKQIHFRARRSYRAVLPLAGVILLIIWKPRVFFAVFAAIYAVSGPIGWVVRRLRNPDGEEASEDAEGAEESRESRESPT